MGQEVDPNLHAYLAREWPKAKMEIDELRNSLREAQAESDNLRERLHDEIQRNIPSTCSRCGHKPRSQLPPQVQKQVKVEIPWIPVDPRPTKIREAMQATGTPATPLPKMKKAKKATQQALPPPVVAHPLTMPHAPNTQGSEDTIRTLYTEKRGDFSFRKSFIKQRDRTTIDLTDETTPKPPRRKTSILTGSTAVGDVTMSEEIEEIQRRAVEEAQTGRPGRRQLRSGR